MAVWTCSICGEEHDDLPLCFGADAPWRALVPEEHFEERVELTDDQCVVDGDTFFIRGHIEVPIIGSDEPFCWSVWCSLSEKSFRHATRRWEDPERVGDGYFGWLCTAIPVYPSTIHLKTNVRSREPGVVPFVELQPCDHPLYIDQRDGVSIERVRAMVHELLHEDVECRVCTAARALRGRGDARDAAPLEVSRTAMLRTRGA